MCNFAMNFYLSFQLVMDARAEMNRLCSSQPYVQLAVFAFPDQSVLYLDPFLVVIAHAAEFPDAVEAIEAVRQEIGVFGLVVQLHFAKPVAVGYWQPPAAAVGHRYSLSVAHQL